MIKPSTVLRQEFIDNLAELINKSELPAFVLADVLKNTVNVLQELAEKQYQADKAKWEEEQNADTRSEYESTD